jgi:hypothetical protein
MKKISSLLFLIFTLITHQIYAQKIDFEDIKFEYTRLPLSPLPKTVKSYSSVVTNTYQQEVEKEKAERERYERGEQDKADQAVEDYNNQKTGMKILNSMVMNQQAPSGEAKLDPEPYFRKIYDAAYVDSYIELPGFSRSSDNSDIKITVILDGFRTAYLEKRKIDPNAPAPGTVTLVNNTTPKPVTYVYEAKIKHVVSIKIEDGKGNILKQEIVPGTGDYLVVKTAEFKSSAELEMYWGSNKNGWLYEQDNFIYTESMKKLREYLASTFGYVKMERKTSLAIVKDKKVNYDEYSFAFEKAVQGYSMLNTERRSEGEALLKEALDKWNKALQESDVNDKKARIDAKVTEATIINCAEAYMWLNNFTEAENYLLKLKVKDLDRYDYYSNKLQVFMTEMKNRYKANNPG